MNIKDLFNFSYPFFRIKLDDAREEQVPDLQSQNALETEEVLPEDTKNEWLQEYKLIYASYILDR